MNASFFCGFGNYIYEFIQEKHALGYPYVVSEQTLHSFDKFCLENFPNADTLSEEICNAWAVIRPTEKSVSFQNRLGTIRELARYMNRVGKAAYIIPPELAPKQDPPYRPHIFTQDELSGFFSKADSYPVLPRARIRHLQIPVYFRILYCCGLRPQEARLIKLENLDLNKRTLTIPESKGHRDRMIVIPSDLADIIGKYYPFLKSEFPDNEYLFPCQRYGGIPYRASWVRKIFRECWNNCHFDIVTGNDPRPYDFRHTFATYRIYEWMKQGADLRKMLPYLSAYMGHAHISHTAYYIHLVPEFFSEMSGMDMNRYSSLIPGVLYE